MLEFKDGDIILTRGDSVYIDTVILTPCEEVYEPKDRDEVYLYIIKKNEIRNIRKCGRYKQSQNLQPYHWDVPTCVGKRWGQKKKQDAGCKADGHIKRLNVSKRNKILRNVLKLLTYYDIIIMKREG